MKPLTDAELLALLDDLDESDRSERKESWKGDAPEKGAQALCAFANDLPNHRKPGVLFVGAKDNGEPSNLVITDELLTALADLRSNGNMLPFPVMTVEKRRLKGADIVIVTVWPAQAPPVEYKGRIWIRVGPRRAIATALRYIFNCAFGARAPQEAVRAEACSGAYLIADKPMLKAACALLERLSKQPSQGRAIRARRSHIAVAVGALER